VKEIGNVFRRVLCLMDDAETDEIVMLSKIDLSDGFWRMIVAEEEVWNFCYVLPDPPGHPIRIVVPSALQMGWAESPPYFCAATETGRDIIQGLVADRVKLPPHCFEHYMHPTKSAKRSVSDSPAHGIFVYVDDFIGAAVEDKSGTLLGRISRAALHGIHSVFPSPEVTGHVGGKDPVSLKKLERGDARWHHEKEILGFLVNGQTKTVQISDAKATDIVTEIRRILKKKHVQLKRYRQIVGKLRHVALILPGIRGLFSPINRALRGEPQVIGLGKTSEVRAAFLDLAHMVANLATRPTHVKELVPGDDHYTGYCDACAAGAGGVWLGGDVNLRPIVWRVQFSYSITSQVVSDANPRGRLTNSDLEMAAVLLHYMVLEQAVDLRYIRTGVWSDNTPTVAWTKRMADHSQAPTAGRLLRGLAAFQRAVQAGPLTIGSIPGKDNDMADVASRSFNITCASSFLTFFTNRFPLPQHQSWRLVHLMPAPTLLVTSTLDGKRLPLQQWMTVSKRETGRRGSSFAATPAKTPTCSTAQSQSNNNFSSVSLLGSGEATSAAERKSSLKPLKPHSVTWRKPSCWLDTQTPVGHTDPKTLICHSPVSSDRTKPTTPPPNHS
jgi:hypothetical protein